jgi:hypothetical protein
MNISNKIRITYFILVIAVFCWLIASKVRCYNAYKEFVSDPNRAAVLAVKPVSIDLPASSRPGNLSVGYARFDLDVNTVKSLKVNSDSVLIEANDYVIALMPPYNSQKLKNDLVGVSQKDDQAGKTVSRYVEDPHAFNLDVVNTTPKTLTELIFMSRRTYDKYMADAFTKVNNPFCQVGIGTFESKDIKAIARFGTRSNPRHFMLELTSQSKPEIYQGIQIVSGSVETSQKVLKTLLSSYAYEITSVPDSNSLARMISDSLTGKQAK